MRDPRLGQPASQPVWHPPPARGPAGEPQGHALGRLPPRRTPRAGRPRQRAHPMSPVLRAGPVSQARYEALHILVRVERDRGLRRHRARARARPRAPGPARRRALHRDRVRHAPLASPSGLAAHPAPQPAARQARPLGAGAPAAHRLPADLPRSRAAVGRGGRGGERGAAQVARARARRVRQRGAALSHARAGPPRPPALPVEAAAVRWSFPDWMAARWIARYGMEEAERAHGRAGRAAAGDDPREYPPDHPRGPGHPSPRRGAGRDRSHRAGSRGPHGAPRGGRPLGRLRGGLVHHPGRGLDAGRPPARSTARASWWRIPAPRPAPRPPTWPSSWPTEAGSWPWTPTRPGYAC